MCVRGCCPLTTGFASLTETRIRVSVGELRDVPEAPMPDLLRLDLAPESVILTQKGGKKSGIGSSGTSPTSLAEARNRIPVREQNAIRSRIVFALSYVVDWG